MGYLNLVLNSSEMTFRLARFFAAFTIGVILTRLISSTLSHRVLDLKKYSTHRISNVLQLIGFTASLVVALEAGQFGNLLTIVGTIAAALTVAIGFGMRENVANYVAGVFIHMQNPYIRGDYVKIGEEEGRVKEIGMRATVLNESTGGDVIVPNSKIDSNPVRNYSKGTKNYSSMTVKVGSDRAEDAVKLLVESADAVENVLERPGPETGFVEVGEEVTVKLTYTVKGNPLEARSRIGELFNEKAVSDGIFQDDEEK